MFERLALDFLRAFSLVGFAVQQRPTVWPKPALATGLVFIKRQEPYMVQIRPEVSRRVRRRRDPFDVRLLLQRR